MLRIVLTQAGHHLAQQGSIGLVRVADPGALVFDVDGKTYRLDAITEKGEEQLFIIFADTTSGKETYGAGRYLYADPPDAGDARGDRAGRGW